MHTKSLKLSFLLHLPLIGLYPEKHLRDTKGTFYAKMGSIKDRNAKEVTEAEDIKKRWQEYIEYIDSH